MGTERRKMVYHIFRSANGRMQSTIIIISWTIPLVNTIYRRII